MTILASFLNLKLVGKKNAPYYSEKKKGFNFNLSEKREVFY